MHGKWLAPFPVLFVPTMAIRVVEFSRGGIKLENFLLKNQHTECLTLKCAIVNGSEGWKDQYFC